MRCFVSASVVLLVAAVAQLLLGGADGQVLATLYNDSACSVLSASNTNQPPILQMARSVPPSALQSTTGTCVNLTAPYSGSGFYSCLDGGSFLQLYYWQTPGCEGYRYTPTPTINGTNFISPGRRANTSVCSPWTLSTYADDTRTQFMSGYLTYACYNSTSPVPNGARPTAASCWLVQLSVAALLIRLVQCLVLGAQAVW